MPTKLLGFTKTEMVSLVAGFCGIEDDTTFTTYMNQMIPLAEYRFCKMHDWSWLKKTNLPLSVVNGTSQYSLSGLIKGLNTYYVDPGDVQMITLPASGIVLKKLPLEDIRRHDPNQDDGSITDYPTMWAVADDGYVEFWPPNFQANTLYIDAKISASPDSADTYSIIPYEYQDSFIAYLIALALERQNDDRAPNKKAEALQMIKEDISNDLSDSGEVENPRLKSMAEARFDGASSNPDYWLFNDWDWA